MKALLHRALAVGGALTAALALMPAAPAAAHVTVSPTTVTAGGRATLTFKVPNESDEAKTVQLEIVFPDNAALTSVSLRPVPGWSATVHRRPLLEAPAPPAATDDGHGGGKPAEAVARIVWRSEAGVGVGEFQTFDVGVGPLPKEPTTLVFKALQTYSNGDVVRWIETPQEGAPRPAHPAMVIAVATAAGTPTPVAATSESLDTLSFGALIIAVLALGVALTAVLRRRPVVVGTGKR